jgi:hypothetical protein
MRVDSDVYMKIMQNRGRLQAVTGENISITDFVLRAIEAFNVE